ncbi:MAG TPA: GNAT family protein [Ktedonobacterales bacterium]
MTTTDPETGLPIGEAVNPAPAKRPEPTTLTGQHVRLVPLDTAQHADDLFALTCVPGTEALWVYLFDGPYADKTSFRAALEAKAASTDPLFFAILDRTTGRAEGYASYMRIEPAHRVVEVGNVLFSPQLQRTPAATEAMYLMAKHAFEDLGYRRYEWKCDALNAPSRRAAQRLGFTFEGIFRAHLIVKGRNRDTAWFSMLDSEWPARKAAFERWLDPANFNEDGRQRISLSTLNTQADA